MYDLFSNTVALRNFLPTAYGYDAFFMGSLSLINTHLSLALMSLEVMTMSRIRLRDCSLALSREPYVSLSRHTAQIDLYL